MASNENTQRRTTRQQYPKPRILLVDMDPAVAVALHMGGYNVTEGTFGQPRLVERTAGLVQVPRQFDLPDYEEQEIVFVNTTRPAAVVQLSPKAWAVGVADYWQSCESGVVDSRPLAMSSCKHDSNRIFNHAGIFVVVAHPRTEITYVHGKPDSDGTIHRQACEKYSNWDFLSALSKLTVEEASGTEILFEQSRVSSLLRGGARGTRFTCTLGGRWLDSDTTWIPIAKNKYGETVAGILTRDNPRRFVLIIPPLPHLSEIVVDLLVDVFADWNPALFPHLKEQAWLHRPEYEIPKVVALQRDIAVIQKEAEDKVANLNTQIESVRAEKQAWYTLLSGTGRELALAVIESLSSIGFQKVVDVDAEAKQTEGDANLREDIQIHDRKPVLVVDVKGVGGTPSDEECRQAEKHALIRINDWNDPQVKPLTIINHERHIPPLERSETVFRKEIVHVARQTRLGLMTTWDLFRLLRNRERWKWPDAAVQEVFYRTGRIEPVPGHYEEIGAVAQVWKPAFSIVPSRPIRVGDTLSILTGDTFEEIVVSSIKVGDKDTPEGPAGTEIGISRDPGLDGLRPGQRVFRVDLA